jgi:hypothetical protein
MLGREVYSLELNGNGYHELDMNISTGIYIIRLNSVEGILIKKVLLINE